MDRNKIAYKERLPQDLPAEVGLVHMIRARDVMAGEDEGGLILWNEYTNPLDSKPCFCGNDRPNGRSFCAGCEADSCAAANA